MPSSEGGWLDGGDFLEFLAGLCIKEVVVCGLAAGINKLMADPTLRNRMAQAGRQRAEDHFSWKSIARKTLALYKMLAV